MNYELKEPIIEKELIPVKVKIFENVSDAQLVECAKDILTWEDIGLFPSQSMFKDIKRYFCDSNEIFPCDSFAVKNLIKDEILRRFVNNYISTHTKSI